LKDRLRRQQQPDEAETRRHRPEDLAHRYAQGGEDASDLPAEDGVPHRQRCIGTGRGDDDDRERKEREEGCVHYIEPPPAPPPPPLPIGRSWAIGSGRSAPVCAAL